MQIELASADAITNQIGMQLSSPCSVEFLQFDHCYNIRNQPTCIVFGALMSVVFIDGPTKLHTMERNDINLSELKENKCQKTQPCDLSLYIILLAMIMVMRCCESGRVSLDQEFTFFCVLLV
jgi:hypothetical protein